MATEGFGSICWWGFSPPVDLLDVSPEDELTKDGPINVLLVGSGDLRHVMKTLATDHQTTQPIHFYMIESNLELIARHLLFLTLFSEPNDQIGLREKTELFLELFGNTLIRSRTSCYLKEKSNQLVKMITDLDYLQHILPSVDVSSLKYKERDMMEGIFKFWRNSDDKTFDISQHWNGRLRHYLAQRYDSRKGVYDWDYHMKLQEMVPTIQSGEYFHWREVGVAFQLRDDAPYDSTNSTLANGVILNRHGNGNVAQRGYWGDIIVSPYIVFGSGADDKEILKKVNDKYVKNCQAISEHNVQLLIGGLIFGKESLTTYSNGGSIEEVTDDIIPAVGPLLNGSCKVIFLPLNSAADIGRKGKFQKFFDSVYFSNSMVHHLASVGLESTLRDNCTMKCETAKFMLDLKSEHKEEYVKKVTAMAEAIGFKKVAMEIPDKDLNVLTYTKEMHHL